MVLCSSFSSQGQIFFLVLCLMMIQGKALSGGLAIHCYLRISHSKRSISTECFFQSSSLNFSTFCFISWFFLIAYSFNACSCFSFSYLIFISSYFFFCHSCAHYSSCFFNFSFFCFCFSINCFWCSRSFFSSSSSFLSSSCS